MKINQALKEKNRLAGKLKLIDGRILKNSHRVVGNTAPYPLLALLKERGDVMEELVQIKSKIAVATVPMVGAILAMAEAKSYVNVLKSMDVTSGVVQNHYGSIPGVQYESDMTEKEKDNLIQIAEEGIAKLQDSLDSFNATTDI